MSNGPSLPEITRLAGTFAGDTEVDRLAATLMKAWGAADPHSRVAQYPASYVATFTDIARAVLTAEKAKWQAEALREAAGVWASDGPFDVTRWLNARADAIEAGEVDRG